MWSELGQVKSKEQEEKGGNKIVCEKLEGEQQTYKIESSAKVNGRREYMIGKRISENPYYKDTKEYRDWIAGWTAERDGR